MWLYLPLWIMSCQYPHSRCIGPGIWNSTLLSSFCSASWKDLSDALCWHWPLRIALICPRSAAEREGGEREGIPNPQAAVSAAWAWDSSSSTEVKTAGTVEGVHCSPFFQKRWTNPFNHGSQVAGSANMMSQKQCVLNVLLFSHRLHVARPQISLPPTFLRGFVSYCSLVHLTNLNLSLRE